MKYCNNGEYQIKMLFETVFVRIPVYDNDHILCGSRSLYEPENINEYFRLPRYLYSTFMSRLDTSKMDSLNF